MNYLIAAGGWIVIAIVVCAIWALTIGRKPPRPGQPGGPGDGRPLSDLEKAVLDGIEAATEDACGGQP